MVLGIIWIHLVERTEIREEQQHELMIVADHNHMRNVFFCQNNEKYVWIFCNVEHKSRSTLLITVYIVRM